MNAPSAMPADPPPANGTAVGPAAQPDPTAFPSIPGFTIIAELGRGGAGVVYEALLLSLNRQVALKSIWDVDTRRQVCSIAAPGHAISDIALHPNGRWLATATREPTVCLWDLSSAEIAQSQVAANAVRIDCWKGQAGFLAGVCVHPDGRLLSLETDGKMHTWSAPAPSTSGDPPDGNGVGMALGYRPDGTLMAAARMAEGVVLWEAGSGRVLLKLDTTKTERIAGEFCFSSDGRRVAAGAWPPARRMAASAYGTRPTARC